MLRFARVDWDAVAGILAALVALVLHFWHIGDTAVLSMTTLVLIAVIFSGYCATSTGRTNCPSTSIATVGFSGSC